MNLGRAIWIGILTYIVSFIIGGIVIFISGSDFTEQIPNWVLYINIAITILIAALFTLLYFRDRRIKQNAKEGFFFGLVLVVLGFLLDFIIFSISSAYSNIQQSIIDYYSNPVFWISLILFLVTTTVVGALKGRK